MVTLYARKESTKDPVALQFGMKEKKDTVIYRDKGCTDIVARWPWHFSSCPRYGQKRVTLNCANWNLSWPS